MDSLDMKIRIREMVLKGQIQEAIVLINNLHPALLDINRYVYFHLQVWGEINRAVLDWEKGIHSKISKAKERTGPEQ